MLDEHTPQTLRTAAGPRVGGLRPRTVSAPNLPSLLVGAAAVLLAAATGLALAVNAGRRGGADPDARLRGGGADQPPPRDRAVGADDLPSGHAGVQPGGGGRRGAACPGVAGNHAPHGRGARDLGRGSAEPADLRRPGAAPGLAVPVAPLGEKPDPGLPGSLALVRPGVAPPGALDDDQEPACREARAGRVRGRRPCLGSLRLPAHEQPDRARGRLGAAPGGGRRPQFPGRQPGAGSRPGGRAGRQLRSALGPGRARGRHPPARRRPRRQPVAGGLGRGAGHRPGRIRGLQAPPRPRGRLHAPGGRGRDHVVLNHARRLGAGQQLQRGWQRAEHALDRGLARGKGLSRRRGGAEQLPHRRPRLRPRAGGARAGAHPRRATALRPQHLPAAPRREWSDRPGPVPGLRARLPARRVAGRPPLRGGAKDLAGDARPCCAGRHDQHAHRGVLPLGRRRRANMGPLCPRTRAAGNREPTSGAGSYAGARRAEFP